MQQRNIDPPQLEQHDFGSFAQPGTQQPELPPMVDLTADVEMGETHDQMNVGWTDDDYEGDEGRMKMPPGQQLPVTENFMDPHSNVNPMPHISNQEVPQDIGYGQQEFRAPTPATPTSVAPAHSASLKADT